MNTSELRKMSIEELQKELLALAKEQFNLRIQKGVGQQSPQTHLFRNARRQVARIKTILREKEGSAL
jgi:large subunit ribosomal protein L29